MKLKNEQEIYLPSYLLAASREKQTYKPKWNAHVNNLVDPACNICVNHIEWVMGKEWSALPTKGVQVARVGFAEKVMLEVFSLSSICSIKHLPLANSYIVISKK